MLLGAFSSLLVGIADAPDEIINKLKSRAHSSRADRTSSFPSTTSNPGGDLALVNQGTEQAGSRRTNLNEAGTVDTNDRYRSGISTIGEEHDNGLHIETPEPAAHNITIYSIVKPKHKHLMNPKDRAVYKTVEKIDQGISNIAITAMRPPMDLILALARGCHYAPKQYGDDTVRALEKINGFKSGVAIAGKQFGLGWYDGITGLATQPYRGAAKHGGKGFLVGIYKGASGLVLKPSAGKRSQSLSFRLMTANHDLGVFGLVGYTLHGIYREIQEHMGEKTHRYAIAGRITEGHQDWESSTLEERRQIIDRYNMVKDNPFFKKDKHTFLGTGHHGLGKCQDQVIP